jgi:hypothetical protein
MLLGLVLGRRRNWRLPCRRCLSGGRSWLLWRGGLRWRSLLGRRSLVRRRGGRLRGVCYGSSRFHGLRIGLFLLRAAGHGAGYRQQAGTNKASQRILHLRLIGFNLRRINLKADRYQHPSGQNTVCRLLLSYFASIERVSARKNRRSGCRLGGTGVPKVGQAVLACRPARADEGSIAVGWPGTMARDPKVGQAVLACRPARADEGSIAVGWPGTMARDPKVGQAVLACRPARAEPGRLAKQNRIAGRRAPPAPPRGVSPLSRAATKKRPGGF